jgi:predicted regulator of Ras-like GTPase activity (Roadblock/LC7/MglB family)
MPSIRVLVEAIRQREGVEAAVILGRDGLLIDSQSIRGIDAEDLAARIPAIIGPADELGAAANRGPLTTAVLEHRDGLAVVSVLSTDTTASPSRCSSTAVISGPRDAAAPSSSAGPMIAGMRAARSSASRPSML